MIRSKEIFLEVFNSKMEYIGQIHDIVSLQWSVCFRDVGSFQLTCIVDDLSLVAINNIYVLSDSKRMAYVTDVNVSRDVNDVYTIIVQGKDFIDMLNQRIVKNYEFYYQRQIVLIITDMFETNVHNRGLEFFEIDEFSFPYDKYARNLIVSRDIIYDLFMLLLPEDYDVQVFYEKRDNEHLAMLQCFERNRDAIAHVFSDIIGNINAWNYHLNINEYKNVAYVEGEGEGINRKVATVGNAYGMYRRETAIDARDISSEVEGGTLTNAEYMQALRHRGTERLMDMPYIKEINVEVNNTDLDFSWIGDRVTVQTNEFEFNGFISQITEVYDSTGYSIFPTFTIENIIYTLATENLVDIATESDELLTT